MFYLTLIFPLKYYFLQILILLWITTKSYHQLLESVSEISLYRTLPMSSFSWNLLYILVVFGMSRRTDLLRYLSGFFFLWIWMKQIKSLCLLTHPAWTFRIKVYSSWKLSWGISLTAFSQILMQHSCTTWQLQWKSVCCICYVRGTAELCHCRCILKCII